MSGMLQVASQADVVLTMLPTGAHVQQCYTGPSGLLQDVRGNNLFIDCSTIDQSTVREIAGETSRLGGNYLDAPVSGGECNQCMTCPTTNHINVELSYRHTCLI